jgi:hypothetical protein
MSETDQQNHELIDNKIDEYLQQLVNALNGTNLEFPITIYISGTILSGYLTSGHNYFDGLKEQYRIFFGQKNDEIEETIDALTASREKYVIDSETKSNLPLPIYIHLRDARCFTLGQKPMTDEGLWWRGKISSVDGFHFGKLTSVTSK